MAVIQEIQEKEDIGQWAKIPHKHFQKPMSGKVLCNFMQDIITAKKVLYVKVLNKCESVEVTVGCNLC